MNLSSKSKAIIREDYLLDHPLAVGIGLAGIISPILLAIIPGVFDDYSINFLPGVLEYLWLIFWFASGCMITYGIYNLSNKWESTGWILQGTVGIVYIIALLYINPVAVLILGTLVAISFVSPIKAFIITKVLPKRREALRKELEKQLEGSNNG